VARFGTWTGKSDCPNEWSKRMPDARMPGAVEEAKSGWLWPEEEGGNGKSRDQKDFLVPRSFRSGAACEQQRIPVD